MQRSPIHLAPDPPVRRWAHLRGVVLGATFVVASLAFGQSPGDSLTYEDAVRMADRSPSVQQAELALAQAEARASAAAAPVDVTLAGGFDQRFGRAELPGGGSENTSGGDFVPIRVAARFAGTAAGSGADQLARARAGLEAAQDELAAARRTARIETVRTFQEAARAGRAADLAGQEAALAARETAAARERRSAGAASDLDVREAELALARAEQLFRAAERDHRLAVRALRTQLGAEVPAPRGPLPDPPSLPPREEAVAPADRPDLRAAARDVAAAERDANAAVRDALPLASLNVAFATGSDARNLRVGASLDSVERTPTLEASFDPDDGLQGLGPGASSSSFEIGVQLEVPLSPAVPSALSAARLGERQARAREASARDRAALAVDRAYAAAEDALEGAELAARSAELAHLSAELVASRRDAGSASEADARRSQLEAQRAELEAARARDEARLAVFRLLDALAVAPERLE